MISKNPFTHAYRSDTEHRGAPRAVQAGEVVRCLERKVESRAVFLKEAAPAGNLFQDALNADPDPSRVRDLGTGVGVLGCLGEAGDGGEEGVVNGGGVRCSRHWSNFGGTCLRQAYLLSLYAFPRDFSGSGD